MTKFLTKFVKKWIIIRNEFIVICLRITRVRSDLNQSIIHTIQFNMPTIKQLLRKARQSIRNVPKSPALRGCPQRRGTCTRVYVRLVQTACWGESLKTPSILQTILQKSSRQLFIKFMVSILIELITSIFRIIFRNKEFPSVTDDYPLR